MCVQYRGGVSTVGDILSTVGGVQYGGGNHYKCGVSWVPRGVFSTVGGYLEYCGGIPWCTWGDTMSTVGGKSFVIWVPHSTEHPPRYSWYPPRYSNFKGWYPPRYWTPPRYSWYPPWYWTLSTVLKITPHGTDDISPRYWTPPTVLKISPHGTHDIPHGTKHPQGTEHPPRYCIHIIQGGDSRVD